MSLVLLRVSVWRCAPQATAARALVSTHGAEQFACEEPPPLCVTGGALETLTKTNFMPTVSQLHNYLLELRREKDAHSGHAGSNCFQWMCTRIGASCHNYPCQTRG